MVIDMHAPGVEVRPLRHDHRQLGLQRGVLQRRLRPRRRRGRAPRTTAGRWPAPPWATSASRSVAGRPASLPGMDLFDLLRRHGDRVPGAAARVGGIVTMDHALKVLNLRRAQRAVIGVGPGPEGNVTKLVLAEHGHRRAAAAGRPGRERCRLPRGRRRVRRPVPAGHPGHVDRRRDVGDHAQSDRRAHPRAAPGTHSTSSPRHGGVGGRANP